MRVAALSDIHGTHTRSLSSALSRLVGPTSAVFMLAGFAVTTQDPARTEIVTEDVAHFWQAFDDAAKAPPSERAGIYQKKYFEPASQGLKDFAAFRHVTREKFARYVEQNRGDYARLRPFVELVVEQKPVIQQGFRRLKRLYADMRFPAHVYFVVGQQRGAGMNSDNGIILAADVFATPPGTPYAYTKVTPDYVPFSALHETVHFNQAYQTGDKSTLLQQVINEGTADFIASLALQEPDVRQMTDRWEYGCPREAEFASRFLREQDQVETSPWLFDNATANGWPPDMGYWVGYRVAQTYYHGAKDKQAALAALLQVTDFKRLLKASGYPERLPACAPEKPIESP